MWRKCPFEVGKKYQVLKDISFLNHHFKKGTKVVFETCSYDFHRGVTMFSFSNIERSESNIWHVFDNAPDPAESWKEFFKPEL